ncbi:MAG TPA: hypothetical protein VEF89_25575 [Solirubrobacteraceae bacterium]|nr:hypothetical protein [Solirubrobacteraceae bacterium]
MPTPAPAARDAPRQIANQPGGVDHRAREQQVEPVGERLLAQ